VEVGLKTTTAGWFPLPAELERVRRDHREGEADGATLRAAEERARDEALRLQAQVGLDVWVDGQHDRSDMVAFVAERIGGTEEGGLVRVFANRYYRRPVITGALVRHAPLTLDAWSRARSAASAPVKAVLTGPYTMMHAAADEHYGSRAGCCDAFAEILRDEVADLVAAGAEDVQLDEPAFGARPDETELAVRAIARVIEPAKGRARSWLWTGYADLRPVLPALLALPVDGLHLEMASSELELLEAIGHYPGDKLLAAGIVDVLDKSAESPEVLSRRVERLLRSVGADRLWLAPDAGLRALDVASARTKLQALTAAAR
jgi:5-methyltetrahydropteroyltriglutamate--homocysteine methyltransferase